MGTNISVFSFLCPQVVSVTSATMNPTLNLDTQLFSYEINAKIHTNSDFFSVISRTFEDEILSPYFSRLDEKRFNIFQALSNQQSWQKQEGGKKY